MIESLRLIYHRLINNVATDFYRYLYPQFNTSDRLTGLIGARGVGKTTLLLQYIKNHFPNLNDAFYVSADHIYFTQTSLYQFVENLYLTQGTRYFFIDEIHKYKNWDQEIKNIYDGFPDITLVFSGSSSLDLTYGGFDLSRRAKLYHLYGLSFREYINLNTIQTIKPIELTELIKHHSSYDLLLSSINKIKGYFHAYLAQGFYPFYQENVLSYYDKILQIIDKTIYEDIANFYQLKTNNLQHLRKMLYFLTTIPLGSTSLHNLAKNLSIDDKTAAVYLDALQATGLVNLIYPDAIGNQLLRRPQKVFLNNTNLQYALLGKVNATLDIGALRELYFVQSLKNAGHEVFYSDKGDYKVGDSLFEIGGKNKTKQQIKHVKNAFLVKDDILISSKNEIPLYYFGFLY